MWLKEATRRERASTAAVVLVASVLLAWALAPARPSPDAAAIALAITGSADLATGATPFGSDPLAPGEATVPTAAIGDDGRPSPAGGPAGSSGGPGTSRPAGTSSREPLRATDRGVSASAIKVGFATISLAGLEERGYHIGLRADASQAVDAYVDYANQLGGVLGRKIEAVKVRPNLINADDQRQKCLELTETHGVFAVIDSNAFVIDTSTACIAAEHKTLLINGNPGSSQNVRLTYPYLVSVQSDDNHKMKDLVTAAKASGFFERSRGFRRLGLLLDGCSPSIFDAPNGLHAYLRAAGVSEWTEYRVACDDSAASRAGPEAVLRFRQDDVTHVLLAAHPGLIKSYDPAAKAARFFPEHFAGDYFNITAGHISKDYDAEVFDGMRAVTQNHAGEGNVGKPLPPLASKCSKILTDHGLPPVQNTGPDDIGPHLEVLMLCENFLLFLQVATSVGPNLTRAAWVNQLPSAGDYRPAYSDLARFMPRGKVTGGDRVKTMQWHGNCKCWKELTPFTPSAG